MKGSENIRKLRQMFNQEANTLSFDPNIRKRTPDALIIFIHFEDGHVHTVTPDDEEFIRKAYVALSGLILEGKRRDKSCSDKEIF